MPDTSPLSMPNLLAIETCNQTCSVALQLNGQILQKVARQPRQHAQLVLPMVQALLQEAGCTWSQLDAIAFGAGPGSFTGLRIAAAVTQGLAIGAHLPTLSVSTLAALALSHGRAGETVLAGFDARMGEVYCGIYQRHSNDTVECLQADAVAAPEQISFSEEHSCLVGLGSAWGQHLDALTHQLREPDRIDSNSEPDAEAIAKLATSQWLAVDDPHQILQPPVAAQPLYLRNNVAKKSNKKLR